MQEACHYLVVSLSVILAVNGHCFRSINSLVDIPILSFLLCLLAGILLWREILASCTSSFYSEVDFVKEVKINACSFCFIFIQVNWFPCILQRWSMRVKIFVCFFIWVNLWTHTFSNIWCIETHSIVILTDFEIIPSFG